MVDLKEFCSIDAARVNITTPWNDGEYALATDGMMIIRVPRQEGLPERGAEPFMRPDYRCVIKVPAGAEYVTEFPVVKEFEENCRECGGSGSDQIDCDDCSGKGEVECECCGQDTDCDNCDGTGKIGDPNKVCAECNGAKTFAKRIHKIGDSHFQSLLIDRVKDLTGIRIANVGDMTPAHFIFDGGDGAIMPLRM